MPAATYAEHLQRRHVLQYVAERIANNLRTILKHPDPRIALGTKQATHLTSFVTMINRHAADSIFYQRTKANSTLSLLPLLERLVLQRGQSIPFHPTCRSPFRAMFSKASPSRCQGFLIAIRVVLDPFIVFAPACRGSFRPVIP